MTGRLTTRDYWERDAERFRLPRANPVDRAPWRAVDRALSAHLPEGPLDVLEVGCSASAWLPYFAARGHRLFGVDYSAAGCRLAAENLSLHGARGAMWCADLFAPAVRQGRFDVVFSNGLVEHFTDTAEVVGPLAALAREGGLLVSLVPNLAGWAGRGFEALNPAGYAVHRVVEPETLRAAHTAAGLETLHCDYCGVWFPFLWSAVPRPALATALRVLVHATARPVWALSELTGLAPESRRGSPWVLGIATRPPA